MHPLAADRERYYRYRGGDTLLILRASGRIQKLLGMTGIKVVSRMMGLILAAMAIQFTADGLSDLGGGGDFHDTLVQVELLAPLQV